MKNVSERDRGPARNVRGPLATDDGWAVYSVFALRRRDTRVLTSYFIAAVSRVLQTTARLRACFLPLCTHTQRAVGGQSFNAFSFLRVYYVTFPQTLSRPSPPS